MPFTQHVPLPFNANMITLYAPAAPGVYGISNAREWIYIGRTENLKGSLLDHMQEAGHSLMPYQPTGFVFEVCDGGYSNNRRDVLVKEYGPRHNSSSER